MSRTIQVSSVNGQRTGKPPGEASSPLIQVELPACDTILQLHRLLDREEQRAAVAAIVANLIAHDTLESDEVE